MIKSLGIDIGSSSIKVVELHSSSKSDQVFQFFEHPLDLNPAKDPQLDIIEYLRGLISQYDPSQTRFILGFRQDQVATRLLKFPFNDRNKINKALGFELEDEIPFSIEKTLFEAKTVSTALSETEVLTCSVLKEDLEKLLAFSKDLNIEPTVLSAEGFAYANLIENWKNPTQAESPSLLLLHIGHQRTLVTVYKNNVLLASRSISWGGKNLADQIQKKYQIPFIEALKELKTKGFILLTKEGASKDQVIFSETISTALKDFLREIKLTLFELQSNLKCEISQIYLTGGGAQLKNLAPHLTQNLEIPVNRFTLPVHPTGLSLEGLGPQLSTQCVALGLAIEGLKKSKNPPINFRKGEYAKKNYVFSEFKETALLIAPYLGAAFVLFMTFASFRSSISESLIDSSKAALKKATVEIPELGKKSGVSQAQRYIREKKSSEALLHELQEISKMHSGLDVLKKISESLPKTQALIYSVSLFELKNQKLRIEGSANSAATISEIKKILSAQALDQKISTVSSSTPPPLNRVAFGFELDVDRGFKNKSRKKAQ